MEDEAGMSYQEVMTVVDNHEELEEKPSPHLDHLMSEETVVGNDDITTLPETDCQTDRVTIEVPVTTELTSFALPAFTADGQTEINVGDPVKTEVVGMEEQVSEIQTEYIQAAAPQQFIILTRTNDGSTEQVETVESIPTKYIRFDGTDGQTYVLAVTDEVTGVMSEPVKTLPSQQVIPSKALKANRKRPAESSSGSTSSTCTASTIQSLSKGPNHEEINQAWFTTRDDKNAFHKGGHKWKQGQWTKEEVEILQSNINTYCTNHGIKDPAEVIFEMSKDERKDFYRTIAMGIQRPLFSVYRRVTRMYDRKNHKGKYSATEMKHLKMLRSKHGNDWAAIGVALNRSASSVKDKCRLMKDNCNSGKWYPEEESRLAAAVYKLTGVKPSESITSGLSWANVAEHVGTRSEKQCRTKWLNYLNWKHQGGADWTREDDTLLIDKVSKMNVNNDSEIDWIALSKDWASVRSPQWLRGKWWALKRHIPDYNKLNYPELIENMKQAIFWNMKPKGGTRQIKLDLKSQQEAPASFLKNCIPVSITDSSGNGSLALSYCSSDDESYQAFEVLQQWTPQMISQMAHNGGSIDAAQAIARAGGHIIVQTISPGVGESLQLNGEQQVIISSTGVATDEGQGVEEAMTVHMATPIQQAEQDLNVLSSAENLHDAGITTSFVPEEAGEIIAVSEYHNQGDVSGDADMMSHDVFETVASESGQDLVMGVTSPTHASSLMTSLKDPILMSSSTDVD